MTDELLQKLRSIAKTRGFEVETCNGWQRMFSLKDDEIALVCDNCGDVIETTINRPDILELVSSINCHSGEDCILEDDERILTSNGTLFWCQDYFGVIRTIIYQSKQHLKSADPVSTDYAYIGEIDDFSHAYFAVNPNDKNSHSAYAFIKCAFEGSWRYALLHITIISDNGDKLIINVEMHNLWSSFEQKLDQLIMKQIENRFCNDPTNSLPLTATFAFYSTLILKFMELGFDVDIWMEVADKDPAYEKYIKANTCPVCGMIHTSKDFACDNCGFTEIKPIFINTEEGRYWKNHIIPTYRNDLISQHFEIEGDAIVGRKSDKEFYSLIIPDRISYLKRKALADLNRIHNVVLPDGLLQIGDEVFDNCFNLKKINLPNSLKAIGMLAFNHTNLYVVTLPPKIETIGDKAFWRCKELTTIIIPRSVMNMGENVFGGCNKLCHVFCEIEVQPVGWNQNWLYIPGSMFECPAEVHWGGTWYYNEDGVPVPN